MKKLSFISLLCIAGLMCAVFSCHKDPQVVNPPEVETTACSFDVILHDSQPVLLNDLSEDGSYFRAYSGKWSAEKKGFLMWADYEKGRNKSDADLYEVVPVTPYNEVWFTFESSDASFDGVNAKLNIGGASITKQGSGKDVIYRLKYESDTNPVITFWTGDLGGNCRKVECPVLSRSSIAMEGIEARFIKYDGEGKEIQNGIWQAREEDKRVYIEYKYQYCLQGILFDWLGSMYPEYGAYRGHPSYNVISEKWKGGIDYFDPCGVDPDYIKKRISMEILGTVPRYATPDCGLNYSYFSHWNKALVKSLAYTLTDCLNHRTHPEWFLPTWNKNNNPDCTWFEDRTVSSEYEDSDFYAGRLDIDIYPADLRGRRIIAWDDHICTFGYYSEYYYNEDGTVNVSYFGVNFVTVKDGVEKSHIFALQSSMDFSDIDPRWLCDLEDR